MKEQTADLLFRMNDDMLQHLKIIGTLPPRISLNLAHQYCRPPDVLIIAKQNVMNMVFQKRSKDSS